MHAHLQKENYFHHNDYGPSYVCDVYHIEHVTHSGFDLSITDNSYCLSPQHMIKDQDYEALCPYVLLLPIDHIKHTLATTTQCYTVHIASQSINTLNAASWLPTFPVIMNQLLLTLCALMSLC